MEILSLVLPNFDINKRLSITDENYLWNGKGVYELGSYLNLYNCFGFGKRLSSAKYNY